MAAHSELVTRMLFLLIGAIMVAAFMVSTECYLFTDESLRHSIRNTTTTSSEKQKQEELTANLDYFHVYCQTVPHRCATLDRSRRFSFLHISKSGGASWIDELLRMELGSLYPRAQQGAEFSQIYQNRFKYDHLSYHLTSLRNPRHHIFSLWTECRFDEWGIQVTSNTDFPRSGRDAEGDVRDFTVWVDHFVNNTGLRRGTSRDYYNCYHPANYQSRAFVTGMKMPHTARSDYEMIPDATLAKQTYFYNDWVAITEFFHESKCLLYYRVDPRTAAMQEYLDQTCHCKPIAVPEEVPKDMQSLHHDGRRRKTMRDLDEKLLKRIAAATTTDVAVYRTAIRQFMREMAWLEASLGRRVVCDGVLDKWEPELAYLNISVTALYHDHRNQLHE